MRYVAYMKHVITLVVGTIAVICLLSGFLAYAGHHKSKTVSISKSF